MNGIFKTVLWTALAAGASLTQAQTTGDWRTAPTLSGGQAYWDNSVPNSLGNSNTWQMWNGSSWVQEKRRHSGRRLPQQ